MTITEPSRAWLLFQMRPETAVFSRTLKILADTGINTGKKVAGSREVGEYLKDHITYDQNK